METIEKNEIIRFQIREQFMRCGYEKYEQYRRKKMDFKFFAPEQAKSAKDVESKESCELTEEGLKISEITKILEVELKNK